MNLPTVGIDAVPDPLPDGLVVLDVREDHEWEHGHVDGSVHISLGELTARWAELPDAKTLVVCRVGGRSAQATAYLIQQGRDAVNLAGGLIDWEDAGRPLVTGSDQPARVV